jgi:ubiquinone/menaquinone biosynthesis C-methylase UbiE
MAHQFDSHDPRANVALNYERDFVPAIAAPLAGDLVEEAHLQPGERVLDVACGTGIVARLAAEQVGDDGAVVGVDVSPEMLDVARDANGDGIQWGRASAEALPLPDDTFDVAFCQMGLQFFPDRPGSLGEMRRVLAPEGRAAINVPGPTPAIFQIFEDALARQAGPEAAGFIETVFALDDPEELAGLVESAGFDDVEVHSEAKTLTLSRPEEFLWQYVESTPLAGVAGSLDAEHRAALEDEVVERWQEHVGQDGRLRLDVGVTTAIGRA